MRRTAALILVISLLSGCAGVTEDTGFTGGQLAAAVIASQQDMPELYAVTYDDPEFAAYSMIYLGDLSSSVVDGVICGPFGPYACEVAVFALPSDEDAARCVEPLNSYISSRAAAFFGYAPEESALAEGGRALARGRFAALLICPDPDGAVDAFDGCFSPDAPLPPPLSELTGQPPEGTGDGDSGNGDSEDGGAEDEYDHDAVLEAFRSGDASGLSPKNLAVLDRCREILDEVISPGMDAFERELAINDYLVFHIEYDPLALQPGSSGDPDNADPYGALVDGAAICLGYASSFQLLMDMTGIRCVTVRGYSHDWQEDHAWNVVELDGEWYCVDVTWNDPVFNGWTPSEQLRMAYARSYFNVTSDYMRSTDHQWSDPSAPEATGTKYAFRP